MTRDVEFLTVPDTWWKRWRFTVIKVLVGLLLLCATVLWVTQGNLSTFLCFRPKSSIIRLQLCTTVVLAILGAVPLVILVPIYHTSSNYFECGDPFNTWTIAYLSNSAAAEWICAVVTCAFVAIGTFAIVHALL